MFGLKALNPEKYREKPPATTQLVGNITVKMDIPEYYIPQITVEQPEGFQIAEYKPHPELTDGNTVEGEAKEGECTP